MFSSDYVGVASGSAVLGQPPDTVAETRSSATELDLIGAGERDGGHVLHWLLHCTAGTLP